MRSEWQTQQNTDYYVQKLMVTLIYLDILNNLLSTNLNALLTLFILVNRNFIGTITLSAKYKLFLKIFFLYNTGTFGREDCQWPPLKEMRVGLLSFFFHSRKLLTIPPPPPWQIPVDAPLLYWYNTFPSP